MVPPDTFKGMNHAAHLPALDEHQILVRVEALDGEIGRQGITRQEFLDLWKGLQGKDQDAKAALEVFLEVWNAFRDQRPSFAATRSDLAPDATGADWPGQVRDRLGLAHLNPKPGESLLLATFEYPVRAVLEAVGDPPRGQRIAAPTALDQGVWAYFFPAPARLDGGRTMNLIPPVDDAKLLGELLHFPVKYRLDQLTRVALLTAPVPNHGLRVLRNAHLDAVHLALVDTGFGQPMGSHVSD